VRKGQRKPRVPAELLINRRPEIINNRDEFGHWECDLMVFKQGVKTNLITLRERKLRFLIAFKNENRKSDITAMNIIRTTNKIKDHVKSITFRFGRPRLILLYLTGVILEVKFKDEIRQELASESSRPRNF
jgi:IS30 family transposase